MSNSKNFLSNWANIAQIVSLLLVIPSFFKNVRDWMTSILSVQAMSVIIIILTTLCIFLTLRIISKKTKENKNSEIKNLNITQSEPYILVVDDDQNVLDAIGDRLRPIYRNLCLSLSLPDMLMARGFDIIIADIANAGYRKGMTDTTLNKLKHDYPYKYVCAISSVIKFKDKVNLIDRFFEKDKAANYIDQIVTEIGNYRDQMCHVDTRWSQVEANLKAQHRTAEEIQQIKEDYKRDIISKSI
ncbi:MAG: hypothetical protein J6T88_09725 [Bacteroidales bacterium]|nr:hypothetical protein [Bacteroidales bacterium]